jgi:hypothetical protein
MEIEDALFLCRYKSRLARRAGYDPQSTAPETLRSADALLRGIVRFGCS